MRRFNEDLVKLQNLFENFVSHHAIEKEMEPVIDAFSDYIKQMVNLTTDAKNFVGVDKIKENKALIPELVLDAELMRMEFSNQIQIFKEDLCAITPLSQKDTWKQIINKGQQFVARIQNQMPDPISKLS